VDLSTDYTQSPWPSQVSIWFSGLRHALVGRIVRRGASAIQLRVHTLRNCTSKSLHFDTISCMSIFSKARCLLNEIRNSLQPMTPTSQRRRRAIRLLGYGVTMEWLLEYGVRHDHGLGTEENPHCAQSRAVEHICCEANIDRVRSVKCPEYHTGHLLCFAIAHNKSKEGMALATPEKIEKLKRAVGTTEPPKWYLVRYV
jgi:hypothetical protein